MIMSVVVQRRSFVPRQINVNLGSHLVLTVVGQYQFLFEYSDVLFSECPDNAKYCNLTRQCEPHDMGAADCCHRYSSFCSLLNQCENTETFQSDCGK